MPPELQASKFLPPESGPSQSLPPELQMSKSRALPPELAKGKTIPPEIAPAPKKLQKKEKMGGLPPELMGMMGGYGGDLLFA